LFQAEGGIRHRTVTGVQTCALPISFTADTPGPRQAFAARLRGADCTGCALAFEAAVAAGPGTADEALPRIAFGPQSAVALSFLRASPKSGIAEVFVSQGTLGTGALALRAAPLALSAAGQAAPLSFFADGSLAVIYAGA